MRLYSCDTTLVSHEASLSACNQLVLIRGAHACMHDSEPSLGFHHLRFQCDRRPYGQARRVADIHSRRHHDLPLQVVVVGHDIIEQAVDDSSMRHTVVSGMRFTWSELRAAIEGAFLVFESKLDLETYGIVRATHEAMVGRGIESHGNIGSR